MANYIREPYSADLDFGTGEWSASAWVNVPVSLPVESFPVIGPELITNGTFNTGDLTGWTSSNSSGDGVVSVVDGKMVLSSAKNYPADRASRYQVINLPAGVYKISFEVISTDASFAWLIVGSSIGASDYSGNAWWGTGTLTKTFKHSGGNVFVEPRVSGNATIDNISTVPIGDAAIATREHSTGPKIQLGVNLYGNLTATAYDGTATRTATTTAAYNTATWTKAEACYTTDGTLSIRVNGQQVAATYGAPLLTLNNSNAVLTIGNNYAANAPFPGSLALVKFSATVPTTEQSQWMYEQEKAMFQPGAQVCLPSSNSVTDLTYDNLTDTWIAAQSTHISEWKGLVRTSYRKPASGSFDKLSAASGVRLMTRSSWGVDIEAQPVQLKKELFSSTDASINNQNTTTFDFDAVTSQTDFVLPVGYTAQAVFSAGVQIFEGSTGNKFTRLFDGFKETIRFATAPGNGVWVKIRAVRAQG